jgi:ribosome-associated translation inhibitor RaiA
MEPSTIITIIKDLGEYGFGYVTTAIFLSLYVLEKKRNEKLVDGLHKLGIASLRAEYEHSRVYESIDKTLNILAKVVGREN